MSVLEKSCFNCTRLLTFNNCKMCKNYKLWVDEKILWRDAAEVSDWKMQYNIYLGRHKKAAEYMNNQNIPIQQRDNWLNVYKSITMELDYIISLFDTDKIPYTDREKEFGFINIEIGGLIA